MDFRTTIAPFPGLKGLIRHGEPIVLVGSCFSDNIGACLCDELFDADVNPFGPIYNPLSVLSAFRTLVEKSLIDGDSLVEREGLFHSFLFHSRFSCADRGEALAGMNRRIEESAENLRRASTVIITLGTTRAFFLKDSGGIVANCHKLPSQAFDIKYLTLDEVTEALMSTVDTVRGVNPGATIIFTVSPLRYTELGAHGNQLSKATLLLAIDRVVSARDGVMYFPAYEVMMDDLRDYRFYAEDMKHPSHQAVGYIYDLFKNTYFDDDTLAAAREAAALTRRLSHTVMKKSAEAAARENAAKEAAAEAFIRRFPKLQHACRRYINSLSTDGI